MGLFSWWKKAKPVQEERQNKSFLHIEIEDDQSLTIGLGWKESDNPNEALEIAKIYAGFLWVLTSKDIMPALTKAVVVYGEAAKSPAISQAILTLINKATANRPQHSGVGAIIKPTEVFTRRIKDDD